jgi:hypothetical protein
MARFDCAGHIGDVRLRRELLIEIHTFANLEVMVCTTNGKIHAARGASATLAKSQGLLIQTGLCGAGATSGWYA